MEQASIELVCAVAPIALASLVMTVGRIAPRRIGPGGYNPIVNEYNRQIGIMIGCRGIINHPNATEQYIKEAKAMLKEYKLKHLLLRVLCGDLKGVSEAHSKRPFNPKINQNIIDRYPWLGE